ncbi:hypothetical protein DOTSEDRAFT_36792 [Dothistroma septosporum NZE10]|uniref:Uncharacterized protein n=1 Tax=Dothistroma septosporum (strain NZE10 / CBS 128990) TaxID=675120 RepID=N1PFJ7_DOTSN|nr:hypothetical protein DOTSEDRAFT_36792 [Dothistroma septosporum NZE10]
MALVLAFGCRQEFCGKSANGKYPPFHQSIASVSHIERNPLKRQSHSARPLGVTRMHFLPCVLFASFASAGVAGGRKSVDRPRWSGTRRSREEVLAGFKYHEHAVRHADAVHRPAWFRRDPVTYQALENVKYYADKVAREAQTALSAGAPSKADPRQTGAYWHSKEALASTEAWTSINEILDQAVSGLRSRRAVVAEAVQTRTNEAIEHAKSQAEQYAEMTKRDLEAYGPAKEVKLHQPRVLVYDRYDNLVEDEEVDQEEDHSDDLDPESFDSDDTNIDQRDLEQTDDEDFEMLEIQHAEGEYPTAATIQPPPAEPQPAPVQKKHGHGAAHRRH